MRNCSDYQEIMNLYIDHLLDENEKAALLKHVETCPECHRELETLQEVVGMFNSLNEEELIPPASFRRELRQKLIKEERSNKTNLVKSNLVKKFNKFANKSSVRKWMPLAAAALLLFVLVPVLGNGLGFIGNKSIKEDASFNTMMAGSSAPEAPKAEDGFSPRMAMDMASEEKAEMYSMKMAEGESRTVAQEAPVERKIIKNGHLYLHVDSYKTAADHIKNMVNEMQGYIVSENTHVYDEERKLLAGSLALRVPQERFDEALERIENMGIAQNRNIDTQDVTEEYVDIESRLKAMRLKEERLLAILNKSGSLGDVLAVENELARTRADLEALQGRLKYLDNRTELSTINVQVRETLTPVKQIKTTGLHGVLTRTQEAFIKSINTIIIGFGNFIVALGAYLPFIVLGIILLIGLWIAGRKAKKKFISRE